MARSFVRAMQRSVRRLHPPNPSSHLIVNVSHISAGLGLIAAWALLVAGALAGSQLLTPTTDIPLARILQN